MSDAPASPPSPAAPPAQPRNPLHGLTLEAIVKALQAHYGWQQLGELVPVRCFTPVSYTHLTLPTILLV